MSSLIWDSDQCLPPHGTSSMGAFIPARLSCAYNNAVKYFWLSKHSGRLFQDSLSCGACCARWSLQQDCIKLQQFVGVPVPLQEGCELSRGDVFTFTPSRSSGLERPLALQRLKKSSQISWFVEESSLFLLSLILPKGQGKTCCLSCPPSSPLLLRSLLLFRMLQAMLSALFFCNASFNPLISGLWNIAGGNKNRARLFHDIPLCCWVTALCLS